jgi:hypothetical protein
MASVFKGKMDEGIIKNVSFIPLLHNMEVPVSYQVLDRVKPSGSCFSQHCGFQV